MRRARWLAMWNVLQQTSPLDWGRSFLAALLRAVLVADQLAAGRPRVRFERPAEAISLVRGGLEQAGRPRQVQ